MEPALGIGLALGVGVPVFFVLVVGIMVLVGRARPQAGMGPALTGGAWNAEVVAGLIKRTHGVFVVAGGRLTFTPDGSTVATWSAPCAEVVVQRTAVLALDGAAVELWGPDGSMRAAVSRERINRMSTNDFKTLRERKYAEEFVAVLASQGARVAP